MFSPNLGRAERVVRLAASFVLAGWVAQRPQPGAVEGLAALAAVFLLLNALSARCYLWRALGLDTCTRRPQEPL